MERREPGDKGSQDRGPHVQVRNMRLAEVKQLA